MNKQFLGVSIAVKDADIKDLTDPQQDEFIREVAKGLETMLKDYVKGLQPVRGTDLVFDLQGPFSDPLQGHIHVHTLSGWFDMDAMAHDAQARYVYLHGVTPEDGGPQVYRRG